MKKKMYLVLSIIIIVLIWGNSLIPGDISSNQSSWISVPITNVINSILSTNIEVSIISTIVRKLAHLTEFFLLGLVLSFTIYEYGFSSRKTYVLSWMIGLVVATIDEFIQIFVPLRGPSMLDVGIDLVGVVLGALLIYLYRVKHHIDQEKNTI